MFKLFKKKYLPITLGFLLLFLAWSYILLIKGDSLVDVFNTSTLKFTSQFLGELFGKDTPNPAFFSLKNWHETFKLALRTLEMSIIAIGIASFMMFISVLFGAKNFISGDLTGQTNIVYKGLYRITRSLYVFSRAIPELLWAMIIIFILRPGIIPGALALALHNYGILGKLCSEAIESIDQKPIKTLKASGANTIQLFFYGIYPIILPKFLTYIIFRWEIILRTTIVVGFVGAGGLGRAFKLNLSYFHYTHVTLIIIFYLILVNFADVLSKWLRQWISN